MVSHAKVGTLFVLKWFKLHFYSYDEHYHILVKEICIFPCQIFSEGLLNFEVSFSFIKILIKINKGLLHDFY